MRKSERREDDEREPDEARLAIDGLIAAAEEQREAEDEQEVPDDAPCQGPAHDFGQPLVDREQRDDQLRRIPEGGVQEAADAGPCVVGGVLGRLADQPREWDERGRGEDEQRNVAEVENEIGDEDDRRERERGPEDLSRHAASVPGVLRAVLFDWGDTLMDFR